MKTTDIKTGMILENVVPSTGKVLAPVRVMGEMDIINGETWFRVCDARETATDKELIARYRTWAVPAENLRETTGGLYRHQNGLISFQL